MQQLKTKGYQEVDDKADCGIAYRLTTREIPKAKPGVGVGVGGGSGGVGGGIGVSLPIGRKSGFTGTFPVVASRPLADKGRLRRGDRS